MTLPRASVIVVSRGRPAPLTLCLTSLSALDYPAFEVIVVADPPGCAVAAQTGARVIPFDVANISVARNIGIAAAAGEIVAFLDDDAVAEPLWLRRLAEALKLAPAATGWTRGPDGLRFWTQTARITPQGDSEPLPVAGHTLFPAGEWIKIEGTNMGFRTEVIRAIGGFDPALRFYMDDTDLALRLAKAGHPIAAAPRAQIHHALAPSPTRNGRRAPKSLIEVGASSAVMAQKHGLPLAAERERQRKRLLRWMVRGTLGPDDVRRLLCEFDQGAQRDITTIDQPRTSSAKFRAYPSQPLAKSELIKLESISPVFRKQRIIYRPDGTWCHRLARRKRDDLRAHELDRLKGIRWDKCSD